MGKTVTIQDAYYLALMQLQQIVEKQTKNFRFNIAEYTFGVSVNARARAAWKLDELFAKALQNKTKPPKYMRLTFFKKIPWLGTKEIQHIEHMSNTMRQNKYRAWVASIFTEGGVRPDTAAIIATLFATEYEHISAFYKKEMDVLFSGNT